MDAPSKPKWMRELVGPLCMWDDDGFKHPCGHLEEDHCSMRGADDDCALLHHPFTLPRRQSAAKRPTDDEAGS